MYHKICYNDNHGNIYILKSKEKRENIMKRKLTFQQYIAVASMLFGLFFGAGNLIFPVSMGQMAGRRVWPAIFGFLITGVGLPLLGVAALGMSRCNGLAKMSQRIGKKYGTFFTCALYLTIGPFFAIPRCATVPFAVGIEPILGKGSSDALPLAVFSLLFFLAVLWFSLRPGKILTWIGKVLNPIFLAALGLLVITALLRPMGDIGSIAPQAGYASHAFSQGFLEGYNTMDALAGLAFGIIVVNVIKSLGVENSGDVAKCTVKAGLFSTILMAVIYLLVTIIGTQSRGMYEASSNGGEALLLIASHYYGRAGAFILAFTVTFACLKTSIGLITSCSETFCAMFPRTLNYKKWAVLFCALSLLIANLGLNSIIAYSLPVLMFLYPLAITLIFLSLAGKFFADDKKVYINVTACTIFAAALDFLNALPKGIKNLLHLKPLLAGVSRYLPLFEQGMGWVCPALLGLAIGICLHARKKQSLPS